MSFRYGHGWSAAIVLTIHHLTQTSGLAAITYQQEHPGNRLGRMIVLSCNDGVFRLKAEAGGGARLVFKADEPVQVVSVRGGQATLKPGWDGTLGYSHYSLEVSAPGPGDVVVELKPVQPPQHAVETTAEQMAAFRKAFSERSSRPPSEIEAFRQWQKAWRGRLAALLMNGALPQRVALESRILETKDYPTFVLRRVEYRTIPDRTNVLLLSIPKGRRTSPLLLALHGHEAPWGQADEKAYTSGHNDDFCAFFAEHGWAVLQPATMNHTLQHRGWTLQGEWTWDAMVALDYASTDPAIDMKRVAVCGLSTGAHLAMNMLALDDRIRAGVVGCILSTWNHYRARFRIPPHCDCGITGQLSDQIEPCDWAALAAPKPVQFQHGRKDAAMCPGASESLLDLRWNTGVLPVEEYEAAFAEVRRIYRLMGKPDAVETRFHEGPHKVDNAGACEWLTRHVGSTQ